MKYKEYKIDECKYCAAETRIGWYENYADVRNGVETGDIQCWLCASDGFNHNEFNLYRREIGQDWELVWTGNPYGLTKENKETSHVNVKTQPESAR